MGIGKFSNGIGPLKALRHWNGSVFSPPDHFDQVPEDEGKGKGQQKEHQVLPFVEAGKDPSLGDQTEDGHREGGDEERHPETGRSTSEDFDTVKAMKAPIM